MTDQNFLNKVQEYGLEVLNVKKSFMGGDTDVDLILECDITLKKRDAMRGVFSTYIVTLSYITNEGGVETTYHIPMCWPEPWTVFDGLAGGVTNYGQNDYGHRTIRNEISETMLSEVLKCLKRWIDCEKRLNYD